MYFNIKEPSSLSRSGKEKKVDQRNTEVDGHESLLKIIFVMDFRRPGGPKLCIPTMDRLPMKVQN